MGAKGAAEIIFRREIAGAQDPEQELQNKEKEYAAAFANPYRAAEKGFVDDVIFPEETRERIIKALLSLKSKKEVLPQKKHGNIPL